MFLRVRMAAVLFVLSHGTLLANQEIPKKNKVPEIALKSLPEQNWLLIDLKKNSLATSLQLKSAKQWIEKHDIDAFVLRVKSKKRVTDKLKRKVSNILDTSHRPVFFWIPQQDILSTLSAAPEKKDYTSMLSIQAAPSKKELQKKLAGQRILLPNGNTYVLSHKVEWLIQELNILQKLLRYL